MFNWLFKKRTPKGEVIIRAYGDGHLLFKELASCTFHEKGNTCYVTEGFIKFKRPPRVPKDKPVMCKRITVSLTSFPSHESDIDCECFEVVRDMDSLTIMGEGKNGAFLTLT